MLGEGIKRTRERLDKVMRQRQTQRKQRLRKDAFRISLVGYTNSGKSTLFNALVKARSYAADQLFATLDTTTRQIYLGQTDGVATSVSLSDTVGFIRDLPHGLIDAFEATLQEAADADLLLHVVDGSNPDFLAQIEQVQRVLTEIGAAQVPQLLVFNKLDALENARWPLHMVDMFEVNDPESESPRSLQRVFVSAQSGEGLPVLRQLLAYLAGSSLGEDSPFTPEAVA
jgi:GTP-binding protein HflX